MTKEGKKGSGNKILVGILSVLILAIIGLTAGIVVIKFLPDDKYPSSIRSEEITKLNEQADSMEVEDACAFYEDAIENAETDLEKEEIRVEYGRYMLDHNLRASGFEQLDIVNDDILDAGYKMLLYAALRDYYESIERNDIASEYNEKIREAIKDSNYAAGG